MITYLPGPDCSFDMLNDNLILPLRQIQRVDRLWEKIHIKLARKHLLALDLPISWDASAHSCKWVFLTGYGCDITEEDYSWAVLF